MTSGSFQTVPISAIIVDRAARQRKAFETDDLQQSITAVGLINPPVIDRNMQLVAGERRLSACKALGWTSIPVQYTDELSLDGLQLIELEENVKRVDLTWQERTEAILRYHELRSAQAGGNWSQQQTADAIGIKPNTVWQNIEVAKELRSGNIRVAEAPKFSVARGVMERKRAREKSSSLEAVYIPMSKTASALADAIPTPLVTPILLNEDFHEWAATATQKFNFIHCDFPYGVNADQHDQGGAKDFGGYADSPDIYFDLIDTFTRHQNNFVSDSAHLMFWFSMDYYQTTVDAFTEAGWKVDPFPLIWYKSDNSGIAPDPRRRARRGYETALMASRGDRMINQMVNNVGAFPNKKEVHMSEKPRDMLRHFFRMFVDEYTTMFDPTAGSANSLFVAREMKASKVLGLERDTDFFNNALTALKGKANADD